MENKLKLKELWLSNIKDQYYSVWRKGKVFNLILFSKGFPKDKKIKSTMCYLQFTIQIKDEKREGNEILQEVHRK